MDFGKDLRTNSFSNLSNAKCLTKICLTVWKDKYDCEQAWTRLQQISEMTEVKKQEDEDTEEETSDEESDNEEQDIAANEEEDSNEESRDGDGKSD